MKLNKSTLAAALLSGFTLVPAAFAGHTNVLLVAELNGREEVKTDATDSSIVGDPNGRGEAYVFGIDGDPTTLCYIIEVDKIQLAGTATAPGGATGMAAHIHRGARGTNGPVVANLAGPFDGNAADCLTELEAGKFPGDPVDIVQEILNNPEDFYVNIHNPEFPGGAVRGQLVSTTDHSH